MGLPFPNCCKCWDCAVPETIMIGNDSYYSGDCCVFPIGTFTVGAATNTVLTNRDIYTYNSTTHERQNTGTAQSCDYNWEYRTRGQLRCGRFTSSSVYTFEESGYYGTGWTSAWGFAYLAYCDIDDYLNSSGVKIGEYAVYLQTAYVHLHWENKPSRKITALIYRRWTCLRCDSTAGSINTAKTPFQLTTRDVYEADSLSCEMLPATINHTARYASLRQTPETGGAPVDTTGETATYGYNPSTGNYDRYTFTACPYNPSVSLTYA